MMNHTALEVLWSFMGNKKFKRYGNTRKIKRHLWFPLWPFKHKILGDDWLELSQIMVLKA